MADEPRHPARHPDQPHRPRERQLRRGAAPDPVAAQQARRRRRSCRSAASTPSRASSTSIDGKAYIGDKATPGGCARRHGRQIENLRGAAHRSGGRERRRAAREVPRGAATSARRRSARALPLGIAAGDLVPGVRRLGRRRRSASRASWTRSPSTSRRPLLATSRRPRTVTSRAQGGPQRPARRAGVQDDRRPLRRQAQLPARLLRHAEGRLATSGTPTTASTSASATSSSCAASTRRRCRSWSPATSAPSPSWPRR